MGVQCLIQIHNPSGGVHYAGQTIKGNVKYVVDKETEYQTIRLSLLGTGKCKWTTSSSEGQDYFSGSEEYVTTHVTFIPYVQHSCKLQGTYTHPFKFRIPVDAPSSYKNQNCTIRYIIQMKFTKTNFFKTSKKFKVEVPVYGIVTPILESPAYFGLQKSLCKPFSAKDNRIKVKCELDKTCLSPGENANLSVEIINDTDVKTTLRADLYKYTTLTANTKHKLERVDKLNVCSAVTPEIKENSIAKFSLRIPTGGNFYTIKSKVFKNEYKLKVRLKLPMFHRDAEVEIPLVIGEGRGMHQVFVEGEEPDWQTMIEDLED